MAQYGNMTLREREDKSRVRKRNEESQDSSDGKGSRKSKKANPMPRKFDKSRAKYDERGLDIETGLDLCDCLEEDCPGCWMDCPSCGSRKCGHECRVYRRYKYESVEIEGSNVTVRNRQK